MTFKLKQQLTNEIDEALTIAHDEGENAERARCLKIVARARRIAGVSCSNAFDFLEQKIKSDVRWDGK